MRAGSARSTWCRPTSSPTGRRSRRWAPSRSALDAPRAQAGACAGRSAAIKLLLLDQRIVAGLGNIYVCEALFRAGSTRSAPAGRSRSSGSKRLVPAIHEVLAEAIAAGGSTLARFRQPRRRARLFLQAVRGLRPRRASRARAAGRSGASSRAAARPSIARNASTEPVDLASASASRGTPTSARAVWLAPLFH